MKSPHMLMSVLSLFLMVGLARAVPVTDEIANGQPAVSQGRGQSGKPVKPATPPTTSPRGTPSKPNAANQPPQTPGEHLTQQPQLAAKIQPLLPANTNLQTAAAGFKNLGEFIAAAHVSHNLDIPFDQLKLRVTGTTPVSLGDAIKALKPAANASAEVKKAEAQAKRDQANK